jgi:hypothetical protein
MPQFLEVGPVGLAMRSLRLLVLELWVVRQQDGGQQVVSSESWLERAG